jgi:hypothetical protein
MKRSKYKDYFKLGEKYGEWTIVDNELKLETNSEATVLCKCLCGSEEYVRCLSLVKHQSTKCFKCGHGNKGEKHHSFKGHKEIPGSWFRRYLNKRNKWEFNITLEDVYNLWIKQNKKCNLSGLDISFLNLKINSYDLVCTASLDRIDSKRGYLKDNIQLVHKDVNMMKKEYDQDYFIKICKLIGKNFHE